ncbi:uncharacterized protein cubi_01279 [Cryptosporidium ubiquitum]|uniref:Uncharacterized protein n=1 Tax=Cryptosporidium ubiquitum TaxID=857276 RepID=A0A1J4MBR8_9CRYT|nr:uncharacterized protein cubi_01279 [Cryptosporidium ubiquitum]OII71665.1 hypothetical protein cubi_01279 [Cryptosporidium ubiquitum]
MQEQQEPEIKFPNHIVELALQEQEIKDRIWVLITGGDKSKTISFKEMKELSEILCLNLCEEEINSALFWGKYGNSENFKKIQNAWLQVQTNSSNSQEDDDDSKVESDSTNSYSKESLKNIELSYTDFCDIFERNERSCKRRLTKKIDLRNVK